jgi:hypothetical protein
LNLEQSYDAQYTLTLSGGAPSDGETTPGGAKSDRRDLRDQYTRTAMPTTSEKTGQQTGTYTNAAADSASDFYYDSKDFLSLRMRIIGDPAYIFESKVEKGVNGNTFDFRPFNDDGGINFHAQQVVIDVGWNHPQDYDLATGIMPTADAVSGKAQGHQVYRVKLVRSFFSRGKFEQEIDAAAIIEYNKPATPAETRPPVQKIQKKSPKNTPPDRSREYALKGFKGTDLPPVGTDTVGAFVGYRSPGIRRKTILDPNGYGDA